jgi:hypothetical protein
MKAHHGFATILAVGLAAVVSSRAMAVEPQIAEEQVVPQNRLARDVAVRNVEVDESSVSGTVVNNTDKVLRNVQLMIRRSWLWDDEFHPGSNDPSRTEYYTVPQDVPPGGQVPFTYRSDSPVLDDRGGHFVTDVKVASVVQFAPASGATAGAAATPPNPATEPYRAPAGRDSGY